VEVYNDTSYDELWIRDVVQKFQHFLLQSYSLVIYTSADQYLVHRELSLARYLETPKEIAGRLCPTPIYGECRAIIPTGYEVIHTRDADTSEPMLNLSQPWLPQRKYWAYSAGLCRPAISSYPLHFSPKFRSAGNVPGQQATDPDLFLVHTHRICHKLCLRRHRQIANRQWSPSSRKDGAYRYNLIDDSEMLWRWFGSSPDSSGDHALLVPIPDFMREKF